MRPLWIIGLLVLLTSCKNESSKTACIARSGYVLAGQIGEAESWLTPNCNQGDAEINKLLGGDGSISETYSFDGSSKTLRTLEEKIRTGNFFFDKRLTDVFQPEDKSLQSFIFSRSNGDTVQVRLFDDDQTRVTLEYYPK